MSVLGILTVSPVVSGTSDPTPPTGANWLPFFLGSDTLVTLTGVTVSGSAATTATGTYTLTDESGDTLATGDLTNDGAGNFTATVQSTGFASAGAGTYGRLTCAIAQSGADGSLSADILFLRRSF